MGDSAGRDLRLIIASVFCWGFGISLYLYVQPLYVEYLGATPAQIGLVLGGSGLLGVLLYVPAARYADKIGRKRVILGGWGLGAVSTAAIAVAPDWRWLLPAMALYGLSVASMPAFAGYVAMSSRSDNPNKAFSSVSLGGTVGSILAPAVGAWIGETFGLRALYGAAAFSFGVSTVLIAFLRDQPAVSLERRVRPRQLLAMRPFLGQLAFVFLIFFAVELGQVMVPKFLQDARGYSLGQIGRFGTLGSLGVAIFLFTLSRFTPERRAPLMLVQLLALSALGLWLGSGAPLVVGAAYLIHGRNRLAQPFVDGRISRILGEEALNLGYSFREMAMRLGLAAAPLAAGVLYGVRPELPLMAGVAAVVVTMLLTLALPTTLARLQMAG